MGRASYGYHSSWYGLLNAVVCSRVCGLQDALTAGTIALEIPSRRARVAALQNRWDRLRTGLDLLRQRRAGMADLPAAPVRCAPGVQGQKADRLVTRIAPGVVSLVAERGHERQAAEKLEQRSEKRERRRDTRRHESAS
jgi:hypothetical protein